MTEVPYAPPETPSRFVSPRMMQRAAAILPYARYAPKHPALLLGGLAVGLAGVLAWRNRERIRAAAGPVLQNAAARAEAMRERIPGLRKSEPEVAQDLFH